MRIEVYNKERSLICVCTDILYLSDITIVAKTIEYPNGVIYEALDAGGIDFVLGESDYILQYFGYNPYSIAIN